MLCVCVQQAVRHLGLQACAQLHQAGLLASISFRGASQRCTHSLAKAAQFCTHSLAQAHAMGLYYRHAGICSLSTCTTSPSWYIGKHLKPCVRHDALRLHTLPFPRLVICVDSAGRQTLVTCSTCTTSPSWCIGKHLKPCARHNALGMHTLPFPQVYARC